MMTREQVEQFRSLATKERDIVKTEEGGWVGVFSALHMMIDHDAEQRQTIATLTERVSKLETELNEQWIDEKGTVWTRPTAWAYAQSCRVMHENKERVKELEEVTACDVGRMERAAVTIERLNAELARVKGAV